ncbi:type VI secretion system lipoprotein TssJ [Quatrionicoccus australiensis]|uniref:type VI secretion system lipoprotein TssJ n=1 Tax=Quatrionicoccus australiensis TaxID=138118 RepID=UPI001CFA27EA|nr:type VI secretion system lipoprotein TssJ [Quatrionicoccus australiensis]
MALLALLALGGCASVGAQLVGSAVSIALEASGVLKKDSGNKNKQYDIPIRIFAGEQLNTTSNRKSLSLVLKIYIFRASERLKTLSYSQISSPESEKEALGEDLISVREITLIPEKSYEFILKVPEEGTTIGVVGVFREPYANRWKLAFDAKQSVDQGITIGAHSCSLTASKGVLITTISSESAQSLNGVQCNK